MNVDSNTQYELEILVEKILIDIDAYFCRVYVDEKLMIEMKKRIYEKLTYHIIGKLTMWGVYIGEESKCNTGVST